MAGIKNSCVINIELVKNMGNESIKKGLVEIGIGVASYMIVNAVANEIKKLEKEGKLNKKDGEKMMNDAMNKYQTTKSKYAKDIQAQVNNLIKASPFATKKDIEALNAKMDKLIMSSKNTKINKTKKSR